MSTGAGGPGLALARPNPKDAEIHTLAADDFLESEEVVEADGAVAAFEEVEGRVGGFSDDANEERVLGESKEGIK